jgi:hypothetical protein
MQITGQCIKTINRETFSWAGRYGTWETAYYTTEQEAQAFTAGFPGGFVLQTSPGQEADNMTGRPSRGGIWRGARAVGSVGGDF